MTQTAAAAPGAEVDKAAIRATVFTHLAGLVVAPTVSALWERGALDPLLDAGRVPFEDLVERTHANRGYLRVALRLLMSCGWLAEEPRGSGTYVLTRRGRIVMTLAPPLYAELTSYFLPKALFFEESLSGDADAPVVGLLRELVQRARDGWRIALHDDAVTATVRELVRGHLDGMIIAPAMVALARSGMLARLGAGPVDTTELPGNAALLGCIFDLFAARGWLARAGKLVELTRAGHYAAQISAAYGVTVSYLPTFAVLPTLLFGNPRIPRVDPSGFETLVNRAMNVWGSGGAHRTYFQRLDQVIVDIFNRPIEQQPRGICDMGCGDGTLLAHLHRVVADHTLRGRMLDKHPLLFIGADFNKVARRAAKQTLRQAGVPTFHVIPGDINRPAQLASDLEQLDLDVHELLHIRSFLDHNRPFSRLAHYTAGARGARTTGAFAYLGDEIPADELEENLVRHLRRWAPYIARFGLLVLELHTLPPDATCANLDRTPAVAYDGTHGFSDQYLVELPVFLACAREAGLAASERFQATFPPSELATVSLNYFTAA
ncbi:MAG: class I SAM-dependent methyltransferase [bacterium]